MFSRVLVANRGEIAVRIIRALHELGTEAVAVYSTADAGTLHTRLADRAVCIGPPSATESYLNVADVVARMGDKVEAKRELANAGLPLVPGTEAVEAEEARAAAVEIGFPVLLKASAGGGGKGMRLVQRADDLDDAFAG